MGVEEEVEALLGREAREDDRERGPSVDPELGVDGVAVAARRGERGRRHHGQTGRACAEPLHARDEVTGHAEDDRRAPRDDPLEAGVDGAGEPARGRRVVERRDDGNTAAGRGEDSERPGPQAVGVDDVGAAHGCGEGPHGGGVTHGVRPVGDLEVDDGRVLGQPEAVGDLAGAGDDDAVPVAVEQPDQTPDVGADPARAGAHDEQHLHPPLPPRRRARPRFLISPIIVRSP